MEQTHIYDFLGTADDPIFSRVTSLKTGERVILGHVTVLLNKQGLYEVEAEDYHECFSSKKAVYDRLSKLMSFIV